MRFVGPWVLHVQGAVAGPLLLGSSICAHKLYRNLAEVHPALSNAGDFPRRVKIPFVFPASQLTFDPKEENISHILCKICGAISSSRLGDEAVGSKAS